VRRSEKGRFALEGLDRVMHERARLGILSCLASSGQELSFADLRELCSLTDGNLSRHLHALEEAGMIRTTRAQNGARLSTYVVFTEEGRERFLDYIDLLDAVVHDSREALRGAKDPAYSPSFQRS